MIREIVDIFSPKLLNSIPDYYIKGAQKKIRLETLEGFGPIATRIIGEHRTYLGYDRLYTLWQAVKGVPYGSIVIEVGAWKGGSAKFIHDALRCRHKENQLYVCDTFKGHALVDKEVDGDHTTVAGFKDTSTYEVGLYMEKCHNFKIIEGDIMKTASLIPDLPIGLLHLDCDVYPPTKFCLEHFGHRMARGSTIVVDDYGFTTCKGAKKAVDGYVNHYMRMFHLTTGQAILVCLA